MQSFYLQTDVNSTFQQLKRFVYLITETYKDNNPDIYKRLHKQYEELQNDEVSQRNYYKHFGGNGIKIMPLSNQLTQVNIHLNHKASDEYFIRIYEEVHSELIKHFEEHPLIKRENSQQIMELGQDILKKDQTPSKGIPQDVPVNKNYLDSLAIKWVNRASSPHQNRSEFLSENYHGIFLSDSTFKRFLQDAKKRGIIDQDLKTKRYKPNKRS